MDEWVWDSIAINHLRKRLEISRDDAENELVRGVLSGKVRARYDGSQRKAFIDHLPYYQRGRELTDQQWEEVCEYRWTEFELELATFPDDHHLQNTVIRTLPIEYMEFNGGNLLNLGSIAVAEEPQEAAIYKSGLQGRTTSRSLIEAEYRRRVANGEEETTLTAEASYLENWLKEVHPKAPRASAKTIRNNLSSLWHSTHPKK